MPQSFGWCFVGAGRIAERVVADFPYADHAYVASVYAREGSKTARAFAEKTGATAYETLDAALLDPFVRGVYVATPNDTHRLYAEAALRCGKAVLCEKPFALSAAQARSMIALAREQGVYLMEGMWTRFNPAIRQALRWLEGGRIGRVRMLQADFSFAAGQDAPSRLFDLAQGGGGLLDVGVYTLALARMVFGRQPDAIKATADFAPSGVDAQCAMLLRYGDGAIAQLYAGLELKTAGDALIHGEHGTIRIPGFAMPKQAILTTPGGTETYDAHRRGEGFQYEFNAVMADVRAGKLENSLVTHAFTLDVMETLDAVRARIGLRFPQEA